MKTKQERNEYLRTHEWLRKIFGIADHCEQCSGITAKRFEWALKKGYNYERKIENYIQLCPSCHRKYDMTEELIRKHSERMKLNFPNCFITNPHCRGQFRGNHSTAKKIISTNNYGVQEKFDSLLSACDKYGYKIANISMCLTKKNPTAYGKQWEYQK